MTDEIDRLTKALKSDLPNADPARKTENIAAAMNAFDEEFAHGIQEIAPPVRPTSERGFLARFLDGGERMLNAMTSRARLAATTGLVTAGLAMLLVLPQEGVFGPTRDDTLPELAADTPVARAIDREQVLDPAADMALTERASPAGLSLADAPEAALEASPAPMADGAPRLAARTVAKQAAHPSQEVASPRPGGGTETFANGAPNSLKIAAEEPVSTFSVDVDTAAWSVVRSSLMAGQLPPRYAVRVEEMVNYFPYDYPAPEPGGAPFAVSTTVSPTPWNPDTQLLQIGLQGTLPAIEDRPALNLVFLIDTSGSMQGPDRLGLLTQSFRLMLGQLRPEDRVAIVTYAGSAGEVLPPTPAGDRGTILAALDRLQAGGSTAGQAGLDQAYSVAEGMAGDGAVTRVILATDGDFNVGPSEPDALKADIARKREGGIYLSVLGFGRGNLNDALMQVLAQTGNGQAAYIDTLAEAQKVLVDQLTGTLFPIAQDVKIQVEFNPAVVAEYRLIGYETRALAREDFNNDRVDAGEIGAGHQVTALYEVTPLGSPAMLSDPLRYGSSASLAGDDTSDELAFLRLRYKLPGADASRLIEHPVPATAIASASETAFATAIAGFGQLLRQSPYLGNWSWDEAIALAEANRGADTYGYRAEAVQLMRLARSLGQAQ
ncbi:vWA domain-containing protein [Tropicimonas marinistellae]|uniref:vWA domain-containing protein n=1 Tax=Tropicimonas marinistellae TaxID=1739787 RepID=UPI000832B929|nr:VWA domain-containing protein [Tropicimonas marinistellae]